MKKVSSKGKRSAKIFSAAMGDDRMRDISQGIMTYGKAALDTVFYEVGQLFVEAVMYMERDEIAGPDYRPVSPEISKGGTQPGSVFIGDRKVRINRPRVHGPDGEIPLPSYSRLKDRGAFSEELFARSLRGLAGRRYEETVVGLGDAFGVSRSTVSNHISEASAKALREFKDRDLTGIEPFSVFLDTIHRGGSAFTVGLAVDRQGQKHCLGFWEGATENHDVCEELFRDIERRGLKLHRMVIYVTDGGIGLIKALRDRFGKRFFHQRCTIHKSRNIQRHLPKKFRAEASTWFNRALKCVQFADAKRELSLMEQWLRRVNTSAADSLLEAMDELLTLHRLKVPEMLRGTLHSTNPIESMFSMVRDCEMNIKRFRTSAMRQRWLGGVFMHCEKAFKKVKGYASIPFVAKNMESEIAEMESKKKAA